MGLTGKKVDRYSESGFMSPGANVTRAWFEDPHPAPGAQRVFHLRIAHLVTPITERRFRYQWFVGRDFAIDDAPATAALTASINKAFSEDVEALQAIDQVIDLETRSFREYSFASDKAGLMMRRIINRMAREEAETPASLEASAVGVGSTGG